MYLVIVKRILFIFITTILIANQAAAMQPDVKQKYEAIFSLAQDHRGKIGFGLGVMAGVGLTFAYKYRNSLSSFIKNRFSWGKSVGEKLELVNSEKTINLSLPIGKYYNSITIENDAGDIEIKRAHIPTAQLLVSKKAQTNVDLEKIEPQIAQSETHIAIVTQKIAPLLHAALCNYQLIIPHNYSGSLNFTVKTTSGKITIKNIHGSLISVSKSGNQDIQNISGGGCGNSISSDSGTITVKNITHCAQIDVRSESGDINAENLDSEFALTTEKGNIFGKNIRGGKTMAYHGNISLECDHPGLLLANAGRSITLTAREINNNFVFTYPNGNLISDFSIKDAKYDKGKVISCKIGNGGNQLRLTSDYSNIILSKKN